MNGWVKLHRQIIDNEIFRHDRTAWHVFEALLILADTKKGKWSGGRKQLAEFTGVNENTLKDAIKRLISQQMVTSSSTTKYTVYHICNWNKYQGNGIQVGTQTASKRHPNDTTLIRNRSKELENTTNVVEQAPSTVSKLYFQYLKAHEIPVINHTTLKSKIRELESLIGSQRATKYLEFMLNNFDSLEGKYKPTITSYLDLYTKFKKVEEFASKILTKQEIY